MLARLFFFTCIDMFVLGEVYLAQEMESRNISVSHNALSGICRCDIDVGL